MNLDVLLTDGDYKNTYAILRSLKSNGLKVGVLIHKLSSIALFSRLVDKRFLIKTNLLKNPSPEALHNYFNELKVILKNNDISVFLPVSNIAYRFASIYKNEIEEFSRVPVVDKETMGIAQNKKRTFEFATKIGIPIPQTTYINSPEDFSNKLINIKYPCVLKKTNYNESGVIYCNNQYELKDAFLKLAAKRKPNDSYPVIQEYIEGKGTGFYGVFNKGKCIGHFMHERIHEYPITGGASTLAKSTYEEDLRHAGEILLSALNWHGVAMVEFKRDSTTNELKLMEINPKFWGSYELSYTAGINFGYMAYLIALNKSVPEMNYKNDIYFRWTLPHDIIWYKFASHTQRAGLKQLKKSVQIYSNIHWDDPLPVLFNFLLTVYKYFTEKKYPHGSIK
jgi:predicted ATP-grasp superfamily ATP-dependent carboligase